MEPITVEEMANALSMIPASKTVVISIHINGVDVDVPLQDLEVYDNLILRCTLPSTQLNQDKSFFEQEMIPVTIGRGPFQLSELFTPRGEGRLPDPYCTQCGVQVIALKQPLHTQWHNKVADL